MPSYIFYSWQSDLPNSSNRSFLEKALEQAASAIRAEELVVDPVIDRDTAGIPGAPDIGATIFSKIERAAVFVADLSIINRKSRFRPSPNPNVLIELGYALKALGWQRTVLVANTFFGAPDLLPFDLRQKRVLTYQVAPEDPNRKEIRDKLTRTLERAIRPILDMQKVERPAVDPTSYSLERDPRFQRHRAASITDFPMKRERGFFTFITVPPPTVTISAERFNETFLDLGRRYSWILNYSNRSPEVHPDGYTRRFTRQQGTDAQDEAAVTCYEDGYIITEGYVEQARLDEHTFNPMWFTYEMQRHLQLSKELLEDLAEEIVFVIHFEELAGLSWATYTYGRIDDRIPYAGYHGDIIESVQLSAVNGRDKWNLISSPVELLLPRVARIFGMRRIPQNYWNDAGVLLYATGSR